MKYTVIYEKGTSSWGAYVPDLPGVVAVGASKAEVEAEIVDAVAFHLEGLREEGFPVPLPLSEAGILEVQTQ
jgi:predicted RNase H-like HicB family nuclease